jgi:hypothetical protein
VAEVSRSEKVTRYLLDRRDIRKEGVLHWRALMPNKSGETSVFRVSQLSEEEIWSIGSEKVALARNMPLVGRGDLVAAIVYGKALRFSPDLDLQSRHANIVDWPDTKDARQAIALDLADEAEVKVKPS